MGVPNVPGSVLMSCQRAARLSWSRWDLPHGCCRHSPREGAQAGSQFTLELIHPGLIICLLSGQVHSSLNCCSGEVFPPVMTLIPIFARPSVHTLLFAWFESTSFIRCVLMEAFGDNELVFGILPLLFICLLVPMVYTREFPGPQWTLEWPGPQLKLQAESCLHWLVWLGPEYFN